MSLAPEVYIIESLDPDDEGNGRFEGSIISRILKLHGKAPKYRYVRTRKDFEKAVVQFGKSDYRYLHVSAHAEPEGMCTTNQDEIDYDDFAEIINPHMRNRRLFMSACSMVHEDLAKEIIPASGCYSVIGPRTDIKFTDAAVLWTILYHQLFSENYKLISHQALKKCLVETTKLLNIEIAYFSKSKKLKRGYTKDILANDS
ncbi:MAG: hypothetical protein RKH07_03425 [Gammaproteobacteria bacterium]